MLQNVYSIYDVKAKVFNVPFFAQTDVLAERLLRGAASEKGSLLGRFPADFRCYRIGLFDDESGELTACSAELVCCLESFEGV